MRWGFTHIAVYDQVYYLLAEYFYEKRINWTYGNVLRRLGFGGTAFVVNDACQFLPSAIDRNPDRLDCILFLLRYFKTVKELDGVAAVLLGDIHEVVF